MLIVANLIARHRKSHAPFRAAHLLQLLLLYATAAEKNALVSGSGNDPNDPDGPLEVGGDTRRVTHAVSAVLVTCLPAQWVGGGSVTSARVAADRRDMR